MKSNRRLLFRWVCLNLVLPLLIVGHGFAREAPLTITVSGHIIDAATRAAIPRATIKVEGTNITTVANDDGRYALRIRPGTYFLVVSHVAHYRKTIEITPTAGHDPYDLDVFLEPALIELPGTKVFEHPYDAAQRIIIEAIRRKDSILARVQNYSFNAYTKLVIREPEKKDSVNIILIAETQLTRYWKQPDQFKEIITARRQTANIEAENNLVGIGQILDFNLNRIEVGQYSMVSPTATDALDHYNYYLVDTLFIDSQAVFRLEIEPKSQTTPMFTGTIDIVDSTFAVVGVDVGFNDAFSSVFLRHPTYSLQYREYEEGLWLPVEIRLNTDVDLTLPGLPLYNVDYLASCYNHVVDSVISPGIFDEFILEVAPGADEIDSTAWMQMQIVPLTFEEETGYHHIDSVENAPKPILKQALNLALAATLWTLTNDDIFHFNRVEGPYLGWEFRLKPKFTGPFAEYQIGYAFSFERWAHRLRLGYVVPGRGRLEFWGQYRDQVVRRPTLITPDSMSTTLTAIVNKTDQFDYYHEKGFAGNISVHPLSHVQLSLGLASYEQSSTDTNTQFSIARSTKKQPNNPRIVDGNHRSLTGEWRYDSRKLIRNMNQVIPVWSLPMTIASVSVKYSSPDFLQSDFDYRRYAAWLYHSRRVLGLGYSTIYAYAGSFDGTLPPQEYFTVDFGSRMITSEISFKTLGERNFAGNRAAAIYWNHSFGKILLSKSHIPLLEDFPFGLSAHGGVFWTDLNRAAGQPDDDLIWQARKPYTEIGFGISRLLQFDLELFFSWQLSDYDTNDFSFHIGGGIGR